MVNSPTANVIVYLSPTDAELFKHFQKRYEIVDAMEKSGVFNIQFGKSILNFANGQLQNIVVEEIKWHR